MSASVSVVCTAIQEGKEPVATLISARQTTTRPFESVICDQGGNDTYGWDKVVWSEKVGVHAGFETARLAATGDVIVICDSHMRFPQGWLEGLIAAYESDRDALYCSASTGIAPESKMLGFGGVWVRLDDGRIALKWNLKRGRPIHGVIGACYVIGAEAFDRMGGFSPALGLHGGLCEDLSWRALACGLRVTCVPEVLVAHLYRKRHSQPIPFQEAMFGRYAWPLISMEAGTVTGCLSIGRANISALIRDREKDLMEARKAFGLARILPDAEVIFRLGCESVFECATYDVESCAEESFASLGFR